MEIMLVSMHALTLQQLLDSPLTLKMSTITAAAKSIPPTNCLPDTPRTRYTIEKPNVTGSW